MFVKNECIVILFQTNLNLLHIAITPQNTDVAAMLVELTIEANEEDFVMVH